MMKMNKWTLGLAAVGLVTIPATMQAEEKMSALSTALSNTSISGYVNTSWQWAVGRGTPNGADVHNLGGARPPAYYFNTPSKQDGFNLNVVNLVIEKPLDAQEQWSAGYKIDMIYGPDAVNWNSSFESSRMSYDGDSTSDFALKQAYVALRAPLGNGLDFKMGSFDSIIGYESFNAGSNPNYTRSWGYTIEPTQHTGLLAAYQFCKEFGIAGGIANTWNAGINNRAFFAQNYGYDDVHTSGRDEQSKTFMAAVTLTAPESWGGLAGSTLYSGIVSGFNNNVNNAIDGDQEQSDMFSLYAGATINTGVKGLKVGLAYDYVSGGSGLGSTVDPFWVDVLGGYLSYQATEKLSLHVRGEYLWSSMSGGTSSMGGIAGFPGSVVSGTATIQYDLWANVLSRLEFRWDHAADNTKPFYLEDQDSFLLALNVIYKF